MNELAWPTIKPIENSWLVGKVAKKQFKALIDCESLYAAEQLLRDTFKERLIKWETEQC